MQFTYSQSIKYDKSKVELVIPRVVYPQPAAKHHTAAHPLPQQAGGQS